MAFDITDQIKRHIENDEVMFLTTVSPSGRPSPRPVWFVWNGATLNTYSQPNTAKLRHIAANPNVTLSSNSTRGGGDFVVVGGTAKVIEGGPHATQFPGYLEKYADGVRGLGDSPDQMDAEYSVHIEITPTRAWSIPG
jgi:PPOX class probable F420-dependent enzyme